MLKKKISAPAWIVVVFLLLLPLYVALANTQYRKLAIFNSTIDSTVIGGTTPAAGTFSTLRVNSGILTSGAGFKHVRQASCTTSTGTFGFCAGNVTWPSPFADTNYTYICGLDQANSIAMGPTNNKSTSIINYVLYNTNGNTVQQSGVINCIGIHD